MKLVTKAIEQQLRKNNNAPDGVKAGQKPALKLFSPVGAATWLITEMCDDGDTLFGLCDLGFGCPELGYVSLSELESIKLPLGLGIERDIHFKASKTIEEYADDAYVKGKIVV